MPGKLKLELTEAKKAELFELRDHNQHPYLRERATAVLKIAAGHSGREVARQLLNPPHWQDTIYEWEKRYQADGVSGLKIKAGRGRKPAFFPSAPDEGRSE